MFRFEVSVVLQMTRYMMYTKPVFGHAIEGMKVNMKNPTIEVIDMSNWRNVIAWGHYEELKTSNFGNLAFENCLIEFL